MSSKTPGPRGAFIHLRSHACAVRLVFRPSFSDKNGNFLSWANPWAGECVAFCALHGETDCVCVCACVEKVSCQHNCVRPGVRVCVCTCGNARTFFMRFTPSSPYFADRWYTCVVRSRSTAHVCWKGVKRFKWSRHGSFILFKLLAIWVKTL